MTSRSSSPELAPDRAGHPEVAGEGREREGEERRRAGAERGERSELVDEAAGPHRWEREPAEHEERVTEEKQPEAREQPGEVLPDQDAREEESDERQVSLRAQRPARQAASRQPAPDAADRADLDSAAEQDRERPGEQHPGKTPDPEGDRRRPGRRGQDQAPGEPRPGRGQIRPRSREEALADGLQVVERL